MARKDLVTTATGARRRRRIDHRTLSVLYVLIAVVVIFAIWIPHLFLRWDTVAAVLNNSAIAGLAALSLLLALASGLFDFSIAYTLGLTSVVVAWLLGHTSFGLWPDIIISLLVAVLVGAVNATVVVRLKLDSFIGTLATGSVIAAAIIMVTGNQVLTNGLENHTFIKIAQLSVDNVTIPVLYLLVVAVLLWYYLSHTASGRRTFAIGKSEHAARLAGVEVNRIRFGALIVGALIAGIAGILVTGQLTAGSPETGPSYLIPAYAAAYLGLAQSRKGLFNPWGTVLAVVLLETTTQGLDLAGAPLWAPSAFTGLVLIASIGLSGVITRRKPKTLLDPRGAGAVGSSGVAIAGPNSPSTATGDPVAPTSGPQA